MLATSPHLVLSRQGIVNEACFVLSQLTAPTRHNFILFCYFFILSVMYFADVAEGRRRGVAWSVKFGRKCGQGASTNHSYGGVRAASWQWQGRWRVEVMSRGNGSGCR